MGPILGHTHLALLALSTSPTCFPSPWNTLPSPSFPGDPMHPSDFHSSSISAWKLSWAFLTKPQLWSLVAFTRGAILYFFRVIVCLKSVSPSNLKVPEELYFALLNLILSRYVLNQCKLTKWELTTDHPAFLVVWKVAPMF